MNIKIKDVEVKVMLGDITALSVDALVCPSHTQLKMDKGLAKVIKEKGGAAVEGEILSHAPAPQGSVLVTSGGKLPVRNIYHAVVCGDKRSTDEHVLRAACKRIFVVAAEQGVRSLAVPDLGSDAVGLPQTAVAKIIAQELLKFARTAQHGVKEVTICLREERAYQIFENGVSGYLHHIQDTLGEGPYSTVDIIIEVPEGIILIERSNPPFGIALPGGFVDYGESLEDAARREAREETNLELENLKQFHAYSDPGRDPRFHTISTVFIARGRGEPRYGDDAKGLRVVPVGRLLELEYAFDHKRIIEDYLGRREQG